MQSWLAEELVSALAKARIDTMFGLPGGGPNLEMIGAASAAGMRFVLAHGETSACIMAGTYGLLSGRPGVCIVTRGPGVASAINGLAQATLDRFPLVLVSDRVPEAQTHRVPHQRLAQVELTRPITKWSGTLGTEASKDRVIAALALAGRQPAGAVHLDFDPTAPGDEPPDLPAVPSSPDARALQRARALVEDSRRPILLLGVEALPWTSEVREVVQASGCPALMTYQAKGIVPDSWPNAGGLFTNGAIERLLVEQADLILAVGLDPVELIPAPWRYSAPVVAIHPWELNDLYFTPEVQLVGSVGDALVALQPSIRSHWESCAVRNAKERGHRSLFADAAGLTPHRVVDATQRAAPPEAIVTVDAGAHMLVVMPYWPVEEPQQILISNGLATMGFAVPAAIAAALARPQTPVLCFVGDGGLGMTLAELETVSRLGLNVTIVVFNDCSLSLIEIKQEPHHGGPAAVRYGTSDFATIARGMGISSAVVAEPSELERELERPWGGPRLIDARVDPCVYRHVIKVARG
jgi:acetolactate synthase-1/2/3 large subunit